MIFRILALFLAAAGASAQESGITQWDVPPYTVTLKTNLDEAGPSDELTVLENGSRVYRLADPFVRSELTAGQETIADDFGKPSPGHDPQDGPDKDVLGLGFPNLVFADYSGGVHCCFRAIILMLGHPFRTQIIDLADPGGNFHRVTGRSAMILEATDATFKEWRASSAESPFPTVMLSFDRAAGRYVPDAELMRAPLPSDEEFSYQKDRARAAHKAFLADGRTDEEPGALAGPLLDLIYSGHMTEARAFLTDVWADAPAKRDAYWGLLTRCKIRTSPYWPVVAKINGMAADRPAADCKG